MYKCEVCDKQFETKTSLNGHKAWHVNRSGIDIIKTKERFLELVNENVEKYLMNPYVCKQCSCIIPYKNALRRKADLRKATIKNESYNMFCGRSCSATYTNLHKASKKGTNKKISKGLENYHKNKNKKKLEIYKKDKRKVDNSKMLKIPLLTIVETVCLMCKKSFFHKRSHPRKFCTDICRNLSSSINRQNYLKLNGSFFTSKEDFVYKTVSMKVDSNLEKAGIIYLVDILGCSRIERFRNILNYSENGKHRTYNPDFICKTPEGQTAIVEIKQKWISNNNHFYNRTIPYKKDTLKKFCDKNNYIMLWIDFETSPQLKSIYKTVLKNRRLH